MARPLLLLPAGLTLYFSRHGETLANVEKRFQGDVTDTQLTERGLLQARDLGRIMAREADTARLSFVASPLHRACLTMEIARAEMGLPRGGYGTDARLEEINLGAWDGLTNDEARALDPAAFDARGADKWGVRVPGGGENYADVAARAAEWFNGLSRNTFAVSHGAFTRILRGLILGMEWQAMSILDEPQGCVFRVRGGTIERLDP